MIFVAILIIIGGGESIFFVFFKILTTIILIIFVIGVNYLLTFKYYKKFRMKTMVFSVYFHSPLLDDSVLG